MTPREYELAVLEQCRIDWPAPRFEVRHDLRMLGQKTKQKRQVDVAIYEAGEKTPLFLVEAKKHGRPIHVGIAGSTIAMVQDLGGMPTIMVSTSGFSVAAANHLEAESIGHMTITLIDADRLRWIPVLEKQFAVDGEFKRISGELVEAIHTGDAEPFFHDELPYEEWLAVLETGLSLFPESTEKILKTIASDHVDDGHRFNAIRLLSEAGLLDRPYLDRLRSEETDPEIIELLNECDATMGGL
jgi:hypothetical protein